MQTSEVTFEFPVLGFARGEDLRGFSDLNTLTSCGRSTLRDDLQKGMELVDSQGRRWIVHSIRRVGRAQSWLRWLVAHLISMPQSRIEQELDELPPVSFAELRERVCAAMEAHEEDYCWYDEALEPILAEVRAAGSVAEIIDRLGLDSFMAD